MFVAPAYGDVKFGVSLSGMPYTALPNAFKYRTSYDATCSCRKPGQSWSDALGDAERMIGGRRGDTIITEERSLELSRPKEPTPAPTQKRQQANQPQKPSAQPVQQAAPAPGPQQQGRPTVSQDQGEWIEVQGADGTSRKVRVVAPPGGPANKTQ